MESALNHSSYLPYRLESFKDSSFDTKTRTKCNQKKLAEAGFYFTPTEENPDMVTCYACGIKVSEWNKKSDDPWSKHYELNPDCLYLEKKQSYTNELTVVEFIEIEKYKYMQINKRIYEQKKTAMQKVMDELTKPKDQQVENLGAQEAN